MSRHRIAVIVAMRTPHLGGRASTIDVGKAIVSAL